MKKKNCIYVLTIVAAFLMLTTNCKKKSKDNGPDNPAVPILTTSAVTIRTQSMIICGGNITSDGWASIFERGLCWSTHTAPSITDNKKINGTGAGNFVDSISGLTINTTYYVRAYATNNIGTAYGNEVQFCLWLNQAGPQITDFDGNIYNTVKIGGQTWMKENLKVTHYRNGDLIPNITDATQWSNLTAGAYCNYLNSTDNDTISTYGHLYNWYSVNDSRKIAPIGWHIPSDNEWAALETYLGGPINPVGGKMKETGIIHWASPNAGADNSSGFSGLPGGSRSLWGSSYYGYIGIMGYWWSANESSTDPLKANMRVLYNDISSFGRDSGHKVDGYSVRCVMD